MGMLTCENSGEGIYFKQETCAFNPALVKDNIQIKKINPKEHMALHSYVTYNTDDVYAFGDLSAAYSSIGYNLIFIEKKDDTCVYKVLTFTSGEKGHKMNRKSYNGGGGTKLLADTIALKDIFSPDQPWISESSKVIILPDKKSINDFLSGDYLEK